MPMGNRKGSAFERETCKQLSLWWTGGLSDDVFWRSTISGGRATARSRKGMSTAGQYGDIQAADPSGIPLLEVCSIELKRGYNRHTCADLLDLPARGRKPLWLQWAEQSYVSSRQTRSLSWIVIVKRDRRETIVFGPMRLYHKLIGEHSDIHEGLPFMSLWHGLGKKACRALFATTFKEFLSRVTPEIILRVHAKRKGA